MTRRMLAARAFDATHRRLMLAYRNARGGERIKTRKQLQDYVTDLLKNAKQKR